MADKAGAAAPTADGDGGKGIASWGAWFGHLTTMLEKLIKLIASGLIILLFLFAVLLVLDGITSRSLVVEEFDTAKAFSEQGLSGEIVASKLLDRIDKLQRLTHSTRPAVTYANQWEEDIKLEIPQTGTNVGEIRRLVRRWLGREARIGGELLGSAQALELTVRMTGAAAVTAKGTGAELDKVLDEVALEIFKQTQPYRYLTYLRWKARGTRDKTQVKAAETALAEAKRIATSGPGEERAWGRLAWGNMIQAMDGSPREVIERLEVAANRLPEQPAPWANIGEQHLVLSQPEAALGYFRRANAVMEDGRNVSEQFRDSLIFSYPADVRALKADYARAIVGYEEAARHAPVDYWATHVDKAWQAYLANHDVGGARRLRSRYDRHDPDAQLTAIANDLGKLLGMGGDASLDALISASVDEERKVQHYRLSRLAVAARYDQLREAAAAGDWPKARREIDAAVAESRSALKLMDGKPFIPIRMAAVYWPAYASIYATLGETEKARALIALASANSDAADSYDLKLAAARLASAERNWREADRQFAGAVRQAPSIPIAYAAWGESLARRGDSGRAVELYEKAHRKGPGWADPLKLRGDRMMRLGKYDKAVVDYRNAAERAPRWGVLRRNLGIALWQSGRKDWARKELRAAAGMDLGPADRALLVKFWNRYVGGTL